MEQKALRIVFMGTPGFAVSALDALVRDGQNIVAVVTAPDRPAGRGLVLSESDVKKYAVSKNLPVLQPEKLRDPEFLDQLRALKFDLAVVVAFRMLPEIVWSMPPKGTINLHASLLPQYRGAAPINWAIIQGEKQTGVTTFFIEKEIDTGKIIAREVVDIMPDDTAGSLHDKLAVTGARLMVQTVNDIAEGTVKALDQVQESLGVYLKPAPKIFRDTCQINWNLSVEEVYDFIRGLSPYPGAWTTLKIGEEYKTLKILECRPEWDGSAQPASFKPGKNAVIIGTAKGALAVYKLQLEGKKAMMADEFLRGIRDISLLGIA